MYNKCISLLSVGFLLTGSLSADVSFKKWFTILPVDSAVDRVQAVEGWDNLKVDQQNDILKNAEEIDSRYRANLKQCDSNGEKDPNFDLGKCIQDERDAQENNIKALEDRVRASLGE